MRESLKRLEESGKALDAARTEAQQSHAAVAAAEAKVLILSVLCARAVC